jgi:hypothetical protein
MDIRAVESIGTSGLFSNNDYSLDPTLENVSLTYNEDTKILALTDANVNYNAAPILLGTEAVKKVFLTYNGYSSNTGLLLETVVMESNSTPDPTGLQGPGYNDSSAWFYDPAKFKLPSELLEMTDPNDWSTYPYDVSQGFTVVKQFLVGEANFGTGPAYTAFYRAPHLTTFQASNTEGNRVYTDGWYSSYIILAQTYAFKDPQNTGIRTGEILYSETGQEFYMNLTGTTLQTDPLFPTAHLPENDPINWRVPTFPEWQNFLRENYTKQALPGALVYYVETQHLVLADLATAIINEVMKTSKDCCTTDFNISYIKTWVKLSQKRYAAYISLQRENFKDMQCIIETTRALCYDCLYHNSEKLC